MSFHPPTPHDFRRLAALAIPVVLAQLGLMAMSVVDTLIVGRVSPAALAGVALGNVYGFCVAVFGMGLLTALDPVVSQAVGAGDEPAIARSVQRGILISLGMGLLAGLVCLPVRVLLTSAGQYPEVVDGAVAYVLAQAPTYWAFFLFVALRTSLQAGHITRPIVWSIVLANVFNGVVCWGLVFGKFGTPALGPLGAGIATALARVFMLGTLVAFAWPRVRPWLRWTPESLQLAPLRRLVALGLPIAAQYELEFAIFAAVALLMGQLGPVPAAAHQIALNIASVTFMVPLGVSIAGSVLVGQAIGAGDAATARRSALAALAAGVGVMALSALVLRAIPRLLARAYSPDLEVVAMAATLIPIAGVFQVFDGTQVVSIGLLRGVGDTRWPMIANFIGYWLVGLPVSLWFGMHLGWGPVGLWWGLVVGLALVALVLVARVRVRLWQSLVRLDVESRGH
ncbi:MAG: MATE family efflux transporter [Candidatus Eisenbacteria bacterium]|nr:MATE family efflux transporter [Candidatus Eisenbacteria bacterium]